MTGVLLNGANWPLVEWPTAVAAVAAVLYARGGRLSASPASAEKRWRGIAFYSGITTAVLAIGSPIDAYADRLFWSHMVQHVLLTMVAPPLILLGRPWPRVLRPFARSIRRQAARTILTGGTLRDRLQKGPFSIEDAIWKLTGQPAQENRRELLDGSER